MPTRALVTVACPHCGTQFPENARLVRPGGQAWCPSCEALFQLDARNDAMRRTLIAAKQARRQRKERLEVLRSRWDIPASPAPARKPLLMSDVLKTLDGLLDRLDGLSRRDQ